MGMMACGRCGYIFDEADGTLYDNETGAALVECPECGEEYDIDYAEQCEVCGGWHVHGDMHNQEICDDCLMRYKTDENIIDYLSTPERFEDFISEFHEWFSHKTIIEMIFHSFREECEDYVNSDLDDFAAYIHTERKKGDI